MTEEQKELLKEKLKLFFNDKLDSLSKKIENDINSIEQYKYEFYDYIIIPYREIKEKEEEKNKQKEEKDKEKKDIKKEEKKEEKKEKKKEEKKEDKKVNEQKEIKESLSKTNKKENLTLAKTPMKSNKKRDIPFKGKTEAAPKKTRVFSGKASHKPPELNMTMPNIKEKEINKKKSLVSLTQSNRKPTEKNKESKTTLTKKDKDEHKDNKTKRLKGISASAIKLTNTKKFTSQKKPIEKKGKPDKKKKEIKKEVKKKDDIKEEKIIEEKPEIKIVLNDKSLVKIPDNLKNNNALFNIYLMVKRNYLNNKENCRLILSSPTIYNNFGNDIKFLLNDKKKELNMKIFELESFLKKYDDLPNIVSKVFQLSQSAKKSLMFIKKDEIDKLIKKGNIPKEFINIFKIILYIFDIEFDENLQDEDLIKYFMSEIFDKSNGGNLMTLANEYFSKNKDLNLTKEKIEKIENIIKSDEIILSLSELTKKNRIIAYSTFLIEEYHKFITLKTSDGIPHFELKSKNKLLKELKYKLATIENNGIPPKIEEEKKEEIKEIKEEAKETNEEIQKEKAEPEKEEKIENNEENKDETKEENNTINNEIKVEEQEKKDEEIKETNNEESKKEEQSPPLENQKVEEQSVQNGTNTNE